MSSLHPEILTWTGLLTQWVHLAQAAMAVPEQADGPRWRESISPIIHLQAVTFALADLEQLPRDEQLLGLDKAEILIRDNSSKLNAIWFDHQPESTQEIIRDADLALKIAQASIQA